jgi:hypothetical protein
MRYEQEFTITTLIEAATHSASTADWLSRSEQPRYGDILFLRERGHSTCLVRLSVNLTFLLSLKAIDSLRQEDGWRR